MPSSRITPLAFHFERNKSEGYGYKQSFMKLGFSLELLNSRGLASSQPRSYRNFATLAELNVNEF